MLPNIILYAFLALLWLILIAATYSYVKNTYYPNSFHGMRDLIRSLFYEYHLQRSEWPDTHARKHFVNQTYHVKDAPDNGNPHNDRARKRSAANHFCDNFAAHFQRNIFSISCSANEVETPRHTRLHYTIKDLSMEHTSTPVEMSDILKMTDVDYYGDALPRALASGLPLVMYTFTPETAGTSHGSSGHFFNPDGSVTEYIDNGSYTHHLWNLEEETTVVAYTGGYRLYKIAKRRVSTDRTLVLFSPIGTLTGFIPIIMRLLRIMPLDGKQLARFNPVSNRSVAFVVRGADQPEQLTVGTVGTPHSATFPIGKVPFMEELFNASGLSFGAAQNNVRQVLNLDIDATPHIKTYFTQKNPKPPTTSHPVAVEYVWENPKISETVNNSMRLIDGLHSVGPTVPCIPKKCKTNLKAAYIERTVKVRPDITTISPFVMKCMDEFVMKMVPNPRCGLPVEYQSCLDRQRNVKKKDFAAAMANAQIFTGFRELYKVKPFMKSEAYPSIKAPREIRDYAPEERPSQASFLYSLEHVITDTHWYAFGRNPSNTEQMVSDYLSGKNAVMENDFSKYDGTISMAARELEIRLFTRHFDPSVITQALQVHDNLHHRTTTTGDRTQYERLSGGFDTSLLNTTVAAFADYLGLRRANYSPEEAYSLIGLHGGDDSLAHPIDSDHVLWACKQLGLTIKTNTVNKGGFVGFLGRIYGPSSWYYEPNSIIDLPRAMTKFAYTSKAGDLPDEELVTLKAQSLISLDALFPPVAKFCTLLLAKSKSVDLTNPKYRLHISYHLRRVIESGVGITAHRFSNADDWVYAYMAYAGQLDWYRTFVNSLDKATTYQEFVTKFYDDFRPGEHDTTGVYTDNGPLPAPPDDTSRTNKTTPVPLTRKRGKIKNPTTNSTGKTPTIESTTFSSWRDKPKDRHNDSTIKTSIHATSENPQPAPSGKRKTVRATPGVPKEHQPP
jgi:hypothetical protein